MDGALRPRIIPQRGAKEKEGTASARSVSKERESEFSGATVLGYRPDEVVEERDLGAAKVSIGRKDGGWHYCIEPVEHSLAEADRFALERFLGKLPQIVDLDLSLLLDDQRNAAEMVRNAILPMLPRVGLDRRSCAEVVSRHAVGYGIVETILSDRMIEDVIISSPAGANPVCVATKLAGEKSGSVFCRTNVLLSEGVMRSMASKAMMFHGGELSTNKPILELEIPHLGTRLSAAAAPASRHGITFAFRRRSDSLWTLARLIATGTMNWTAAGFLSLCCEARASIVIAGGRGSGKTTLLSALLPELPDTGRTIVMEDTSELPCLQMQREGLSMQTLSLSGGIERAAAVMRAALRMGEGSIVVGEIRGEESRILFESMRTGTAGACVLGTLHASDAAAVRDRIVLDMGLSEKCYGSIDAIVMMDHRRGEAGERSVRQVSEIAAPAQDGACAIFRYERGGGEKPMMDARGIGSLGDKFSAHLGIGREDIVKASRIRGFMKEVQAGEWSRTGNPAIVSLRANRAINRIPLEVEGEIDAAAIKQRVLTAIGEAMA